MKRLYQTDTTDVSGNCIQYAVASLLELEPSEVPVFTPTDYFEEMRKLFNSKGYVIFIGVPFDECSDFISTVARHMCFAYCLLGVRSFKHKHVDHCVVGQFLPNGKINVVHDPNPENKNTPLEYKITAVDIILPVTVSGAILYDTPQKALGLSGAPDKGGKEYELEIRRNRQRE